MRINRYVAQATGLSRRKADELIETGKVAVNGQAAKTGQKIKDVDQVMLDGKALALQKITTIMLNKPVGYVCSRDGQGSKTIYELLPQELSHLKPVGRLDKDSSGLLMLTNDGELAQELSHPSRHKEKVYEVSLDKPLDDGKRQQIENGIKLEDGVSRLQLKGTGLNWTVTMHEGRNRQIRRTFSAVGYSITKLHRVQLGLYKLNGLKVAETRVL